MIQDAKYKSHFIADEGKVLTNADGAFGREIWLGTGDSIENWREVDMEEMNA